MAKASDGIDDPIDPRPFGGNAVEASLIEVVHEIGLLTAVDAQQSTKAWASQEGSQTCAPPAMDARHASAQGL